MPPFRFLHLIPELRNRVYEEALTHNRANGQTATVALLRTCRQIHSEARWIFYALSTLNIHAECHSSGPTFGSTREAVLSGDINFIVDTSEFATNDFNGAFYPPPSAPARIVLQLRVESDSFDDSRVAHWHDSICHQARLLLFAVVEWLGLDNRAHQLHLTLLNSEVYSGRNSIAKGDFSPLVRLHSRNELSICGLDDEVAQYLDRLRLMCPPSSVVDEPFRRLIFSSNQGIQCDIAFSAEERVQKDMDHDKLLLMDLLLRRMDEMQINSA